MGSTALVLDLSGYAPSESAYGADVQPIGDETRALALASAMHTTGTSGRALADRMGVSEKIVRDLLHRARPITDARVDSFPPRLRAAFERALSATWSDRAEQLPLF